MTKKQKPLIREDESGYLDRNDCFYEDLWSILGHYIGKCGCGFSEQVVDYVASIMTRIEAKDSALYEYENKPELELVLHVLDDKGLTEHGSSIPGWLTEDGKEWLKFYKLLPNSNETK